jgi:hypothetical protein
MEDNGGGRGPPMGDRGGPPFGGDGPPVDRCVYTSA